MTGLPALDPWARLRRHTTARIGLGRAGDALPTASVLRFEAAHALARDAVHDTLDADHLAEQLAARLPEGPVRGLPTGLFAEPLRMHSAAPDRAAYLQRPDLGRRLSAPSRAVLAAQPMPPGGGYDLALVLADGLSARAVEAHAVDVAIAVVERLSGWTVAPPVIAQQARVALGDEVGHLLTARLVVVLIGERPGLSAPDSLGAYLTWNPGPGRRDSERNCVSNIRPPHGQSIGTAADTIAALALGARRLGLTGVALKDDAPQDPPSALRTTP